MTKISIALFIVLAASVSAVAATGETPVHLLLMLHNHLFHVFQHLLR